MDTYDDFPFSPNPLQPEEPPLAIDAWRQVAPWALRDQRDDYRNLLLGMTALATQDGRLAITRASGDSASAALALAEQVAVATGSRSEIAWGWCALAGVSSETQSDLGSIVAAKLAVAVRLDELAQRARHGGQRREAVRLSRLAHEWARSLARHFVGLSGHREWVRSLATVGAAAIRTDEGAAVQTDEASLTVVREIPLARGSHEDRQLVEAWKCLTRPLSFRGAVAPRLLASVLEAKFPWAEEAITALVGDLGLRQAAGRPWAKFRPTLLVGPPGCGKTFLVQELARLLGVGFGMAAAGGSADNRSLVGTARGWSSATPAYPLHVMRGSRCANPIILLDELDKAGGSDRNGDIRKSLLAMIEPVTARAWPDEALIASVDLSEVNWFATANRVEPLKGPLLNWFRVLEIPAPRPEHFDAVLASICRELAADLEVDAEALPPIPPALRDRLARAFNRGVSIRRLRSALEASVTALGGLRRVLH